MEKDDILKDNSPIVKTLLTAMESIESNLAQESKDSYLNGERYLNNKQVGVMLQISQRTLQEYRDKGKIAFYKLEGKILYAESDILKMLEDNYYKAWEQDCKR